MTARMRDGPCRHGRKPESVANKKHVLHGALLALSLARPLFLQGCNGGSVDNTASGSSAGVGLGWSGYSTGTVTGFGSVVVDGCISTIVNATADSEVSGGTTEPADAAGAARGSGNVAGRRSQGDSRHGRSDWPGTVGR